MGQHQYKGVWVRDNDDEYVVDEMAADPYRLAELSTPSVVLDLGANIGAFALSARRRWPNARIICYEPEPDNFGLLCRNIAEAGVEAHQSALWAPGVDRVWLVPQGGKTASSATEGLLEAPAVCLDKVIAELGSVDLLKIDVEGAEVDILLDASPATLSQIEVIVGEFHGAGDPRWTSWLRYLAAFFEVQVVAHPFPYQDYGGLFWARRGLR